MDRVVVAVGMADPDTHVPRIDDPAYVDGEYAGSDGLAARSRFWHACRGPQPVDLARERILAGSPGRVLEVGCGEGVLASQLADGGVDVTAIDRSPRMVAITAARGVRALRADVRQLPFDDGAFDLVVAAYMLYHLPDIPRALAEIGRVLAPSGSLVAVTNSVTKLHEMWDLVGRGRDDGLAETFSRENGEALLRPHFAHVERLDVDELFRVTEAAMSAYIRATRFAGLADRLPTLSGGLEVTAAGSVFIATR